MIAGGYPLVNPVASRYGAPMAEHLKKQLAVRLSDESHKLLAKLAKRHGGKANAVEIALRKLDGENDMTKEQLIAEITRRLK